MKILSNIIRSSEWTGQKELWLQIILLRDPCGKLENNFAKNTAFS